MDVVNDILVKSAKEAENFKTTDVEKHLELEYDIGSLMASDTNVIDVQKLKANKNEYLLSLARDNTQLLFNKIWTLPTDKIDGIIVGKLPKQTTILPRAQPLPKPRQPTKWEKFAKEKGIQKKAKDKLIWDETLKKWVPRYGFRKAKAEKEKQWLIEVKKNEDPFEDKFEKERIKKEERVAKNEFQRLRNIAKHKNIKIPKAGLAPVSKPSANQLGAALTVAKVSTASLGKFQKGLQKEKVAKKVKEFLPGNRKRKLPLPSAQDEKKQNIELIDSILNKKPKLNLERAVDKQVHSDVREEQMQKQSKKPKKTKSGKTKAGAKGGKFRGPPLKKSGGKRGNVKGSGGSSGGKKVKGRKRR